MWASPRHRSLNPSAVYSRATHCTETDGQGRSLPDLQSPAINIHRTQRGRAGQKTKQCKMSQGRGVTRLPVVCSPKPCPLKDLVKASAPPPTCISIKVDSSAGSAYITDFHCPLYRRIPHGLSLCSQLVPSEGSGLNISQQPLYTYLSFHLFLRMGVKHGLSHWRCCISGSHSYDWGERSSGMWGSAVR